MSALVGLVLAGDDHLFFLFFSFFFLSVFGFLHFSHIGVKVSLGVRGAGQWRVRDRLARPPCMCISYGFCTLPNLGLLYQ